MSVFADRTDAGRRLAADLTSRLADLASDVVVLGLPRGGVVVAYEVAQALHAPLDVLVVRKLGVPTQPELAMGAVGEEGVLVLDDRVLGQAHVPSHVIEEVAARQREALADLAGHLRPNGRAPLPLAGRTALLVDDGIATGSTARAACRTARARGARRVLLAAPVAPPGVTAALAAEADDVVCLQEPESFSSVSRWYRDFPQTSTDEVRALLDASASGDRA